MIAQIGWFNQSGVRCFSSPASGLISDRSCFTPPASAWSAASMSNLQLHASMHLLIGPSPPPPPPPPPPRAAAAAAAVSFSFPPACFPPPAASMDSRTCA